MGELLTLEEAQALRETLRREGKTLVFTNGHFDLLHAGPPRIPGEGAGTGRRAFRRRQWRRLHAAAERRGSAAGAREPAGETLGGAGTGERGHHL